MMYATEHDDKVWTIPRGQGEWMEVLRKYYLDVDKIRLCPAATRPCQDTDPGLARTRLLATQPITDLAGT